LHPHIHILRGTYGQFKLKNRQNNDEELEKLTKAEDIVKYIREQSIKWWGYLNRMEKTKTVRKITERNPIGMSPKGRPKNRWRDEVLNDLKKLKAKNWTRVVTDRKAWYKLVQEAKTRNGLLCQKKKKKKKKEEEEEEGEEEEKEVEKEEEEKEVEKE
jgi:hypothetical protein